MTASTLSQPELARSPFPVAAWSTIAGGVMTAVLGIPFASLQSQVPLPWWVSALNAVSHLLLFIGMIGLARAGVAGQGRLAPWGMGLSLVALALLTVAELAQLAQSGVADILYPVSTIVQLVGLVLVGVGVLRAGRWGGWHRFTPLACGLFIPFVMIPSIALQGSAMHYAIGAWGLCWLLLGMAQRAEG